MKVRYQLLANEDIHTNVSRDSISLLMDDLSGGGMDSSVTR